MLDKGTGNKTWKERGVGDVKFLQHRETGRIRVLMRQEKTMKIIINHFLDPRIILSPNVSNDKSWVWVAFDFSDLELVETVSDGIIIIVVLLRGFISVTLYAYFFNRLLHFVLEVKKLQIPSKRNSQSFKKT
jgi:hypothetical protein